MDRKEYDRYWKMDRYWNLDRTEMVEMVRKLGYSGISDSMPKWLLAKRLHRRDRQLPCYENCSEEELAQFARHRGLPPVEKRKVRDPRSGKYVMSKHIPLIRTLEAEDACPKFHRFLDLPPELRVHIYEMYVEDFGKTLKLPTKPPLARICRLVREEFVPVFFASHKIELHIIAQHRDWNFSRFRQDDPTTIFLLHLSAKDISTIKAIRFVVQEKSIHKGRDERKDLFVVALQLHKRGLQFSAKFMKGWKESISKQQRERVKKYLSRLSCKIRTTLHSAGGLQERNVLTAKDIYELRTMLEEAIAE